MRAEPRAERLQPCYNEHRRTLGEDDRVDGEAWLCTVAKLDELAAIRRFVEGAAVDLGADLDAIADMLLAVTEVVTNIIVHGYEGASGIIELTVSKPGTALVVRLRDHAPPFDPTATPVPDHTLPLEQRPLGGMGVFLTIALLDEVRHRIPEQGGNELTLVKHCTD